MDTSVTVLLQRLREGDRAASGELISMVYTELHRIAASRLNRERPGHTLQPTALVNEVYLRMFGKATPEMADKAHFLAVASQIMRRILVDHARTKSTKKRGGPRQKVELDVTMALEGAKWHPVDILELNTALDALATENTHLAEVIELFHFGGLTAEEAAAATGRSVHTIRKDVRLAQAWLRRRLAGRSDCSERINS